MSTVLTSALQLKLSVSNPGQLCCETAGPLSVKSMTVDSLSGMAIGSMAWPLTLWQTGPNLAKLRPAVMLSRWWASLRLYQGQLDNGLAHDAVARGLTAFRALVLATGVGHVHGRLAHPHMVALCQKEGLEQV